MIYKDTPWQDQLIMLYLVVCQHYQQSLWVQAQRFSNNNQPSFSDEELMTLYLFGTLKHHRSVRAIYDYTSDHLLEWFPELPSYGGFIQRINRLGSAFAQLADELMQRIPELQDLPETAFVPPETPIALVDAFPIIMAQHGRGDTARVAHEVADKGHCAAKRLYYHGVKVHLIAERQPGHLPRPRLVEISPASTHDLTALHGVWSRLGRGWLIGDKIYRDGVVGSHLEKEQGLELITPIQRKKGQAALTLFEQVYSARVSRLRQPIESFFNWLEQKTGIQRASQVRSLRGLQVHVFGKLAAAMFLLAFYP